MAIIVELISVWKRLNEFENKLKINTEEISKENLVNLNKELIDKIISVTSKQRYQAINSLAKSKMLIKQPLTQ